MKTVKFAVFIVLITLLIAGCGKKAEPSNAAPQDSGSTNSTISPSPTAAPLPTNTPLATEQKKPEPLKDNEVLDILAKAAKLGAVPSSDKSNRINEVYDYYSGYFTKNYVDHIILQNMKQQGDKWTIAYPESELAEGSYYDINFNDKTIVDQAETKVTVTNFQGDGLYAAHKEIVTLIYTDAGWRIDQLTWENHKA
jgi:hypothetical protein